MKARLAMALVALWAAHSDACGSPEALRALIAFPDFAVPYEIDLGALDRVFEGTRLSELRAKGAQRTLAEDLEILWRTTDRTVARSLAEAALAKSPDVPDRTALLAVLGRIEAPSEAYAATSGATLAEKRARVALAQLELERLMAAILGPAAGDGWALSPMAVLAVGKVMRDLPEATVLERVRVRATIDAAEAGLAKELDASPTDGDLYRLWLRTRSLQATLTMLETMLDASVDQWAERTRAPMVALHREAFARARETHNFDALAEIVVGVTALGAAGPSGFEALRTLVDDELAVLANAAKSPEQRLAAKVADGALRYSVLADDAGALKSLRGAWDGAAERPEVRKALAWPIVVSYAATGAWAPGLEFVRSARTFLSDPVATQLEAKFLFEVGSYEEAGLAAARIDAAPLVFWRSFALATIATKRATDQAALKAVSEEFGRLLPLILAGSDQELKGDANHLAAILAGLLGDREGAQVGLAALQIREGETDRVKALAKALEAKRP